MMTWMKRQSRMLMAYVQRPGSTHTRVERTDVAVPPKPQRFTGPREYAALHKYLDDRFADTVVLTFGQIEDILGFELPHLARNGHDWWENVSAGTAPSPQSRCWTQASRTAEPNMHARTVAFERV